MRKLWLLLTFFPALVFGSGIYNPGSTGGGGSGGYALQPATVTINAAQGVTLPDNTTVSTGAINLEQLQNVGNAQGMQNGNFQTWSNGTSFSSPAVGTAVATDWVVADNFQTAGYTISQEASIVHGAKYSLKTNITSATSNGRLWIKQTIPNYLEYVGSSVTVSCVLYAVNNSPGPSVALAVQDSVSGSTSSTVAVDSTWHQVSVTHFVSTNTTSLSVWVGMPLNNPLATGAFYVDNVMLVPGLTPVPFIPQPYGVQFIYSSTNTQTSTSNTTPTDTTLTATITPTSASSKIMIFVTGSMQENTANKVAHATITNGSTNLAGPDGIAFVFDASGNHWWSVGMNILDTPASTSAQTYKVRIWNDSGGTVSWGTSNSTSSMLLVEIQ